MQLVYVGLGGNLGNTVEVFKSVLKEIAALQGIEGLKVSGFYETLPVSDLPQPLFVNAACCFKTTLKAHDLLRELQEIERRHGKIPKPQNAPRIIDLDILFFGTQRYQDDDLEIPHPRVLERLFVLVPLLDLTHSIFMPGEVEPLDLKQLIESFPNTHGINKLGDI